MRTRSEYQKALKKYSVVKILKMYRNNQIELSMKEWKDLHRRIDRKLTLKFVDNKKIKFKFVLLGFVIIVLVSMLSIGGKMDQMTKCNKANGFRCTDYQVEKLGD